MLHPESIPDVSRETLERFLQLVLKWNKTINLIARSSEKDGWSRHVANSAVLSHHLSETECIVDLGSGGGFPGIVLGILQPERRLYLIESDDRKSAFLREAVRVFQLNATVLSHRVEDLNSLPQGVFTSRGFASVLSTLQMTARFIQKETRFFLLKGKRVDQELEEAAKEWNFELKKHSMPAPSDGWLVELSQIEQKN